jgi:hypothetical protein
MQKNKYNERDLYFGGFRGDLAGAQTTLAQCKAHLTLAANAGVDCCRSRAIAEHLQHQVIGNILVDGY